MADQDTAMGPRLDPHQLRNEQLFRQNRDPEAINIALGLLRTAIEYPRSAVSAHMNAELAPRREIGITTTRVLEALRSFADKQAEAGSDPRWQGVRRVLAQQENGSSDSALAMALLDYVDRFQFPSEEGSN